jgi:hypothetical protein
VLFRRTQAVSRVAVGIAGAGKLKEKLSHGKFGVAVPKADETCDERHNEDFQEWVLLDNGDASERPGPDTGGFDEESTENTANAASEYERSKLEEFPVQVVAHLE